MKLRNKKTGKIGRAMVCGDSYMIVDVNDERLLLAEYLYLEHLMKEWEDYEEPKWGYIIDPMDEGGYSRDDDCFEEADRQKAKELGIWFETIEETEKAVEKLKAWKRLKDKGFDRVFGLELSDALCGGKTVAFKLLIDDKDSIEDIKLLFGGEY